jgi:cell division transport system ATP-binding protein
VPAVEFNRVTKHYPDGCHALQEASFALEAGEFVFLTGHSGAGKTTALRLIPAIERATSGAVLVHGQNVGALRRAAIPFLRRGLGILFQDQKLLHDRNVFENVLLPLAICGEPPREAARRARAALDKVGLRGRERAMPVTLSGGEQQRVCIARAVVARPSVLVADEPTANLDSEAAAGVMEIFRAFHQVGVTVLVATHDSTLVERFGFRAVRLDHGRVVAPAGAPAAVR